MTEIVLLRTGLSGAVVLMQKPEGYSGSTDAPGGEVLLGPRWHFWSQNRHSGEGANPHVSGPNQFGKPTSMLFLALKGSKLEGGNR